MLLLITGGTVVAEDPKASDHVSKVVLKKLEEKIPLQFNEAPLEDVLKFIKAASSGPSGDDGIPFGFDREGMKRAGKTPTSRVTINSKGEPLKTSLRQLLKPLGLTYSVKKGVLTITAEPKD